MIRKFEISDMERILKIEKQCFSEEAFSETHFLYYYRYHPNSFFVYENENKVLGYIIFTNEHIVSVVVDSGYRERGIGTELMNEAIRKNKKLSLEVRESNTRSIKFYEKLGFKKISRLINYYGTKSAYKMKTATE